MSAGRRVAASVRPCTAVTPPGSRPSPPVGRNQCNRGCFLAPVLVLEWAPGVAAGTVLGMEDLGKQAGDGPVTHRCDREPYGREARGARRHSGTTPLERGGQVRCESVTAERGVCPCGKSG
ncbi:hypothetical protein GCM10010329_10890 [Streptomyces spiroverticillatus]|uniref:Uncharacterized protein n=1 Tax=Streptomyces finlayi TaxID=67296 RepID=A0A919CAI8_9ACTN|nr:hypothetical protein GCM10010329_10890 [Streptomyces spiroverticillatus]GHC93272.1 hypothetical protein GCM10010334_30200 [Streptomyces finlayi]